jgi:exoribonuclease II
MALLSSFPGIQIDRKHAGEPIDQTLVNNALTFYSEVAESTRKNDPKHFAKTMIKEKASFYYDEASNFIESSTFMDKPPKVILVKFTYYYLG